MGCDAGERQGPGQGIVDVGRLSRPRSGSVSAATDGRETLSEVLVDGHPKRKTARVLAVIENTPLESMRKMQEPPDSGGLPAGDLLVGCGPDRAPGPLSAPAAIRAATVRERLLVYRW